MDVAVLAIVLVGLAAFVAAPLYRQGTPPRPRVEAGDPGGADAIAIALEDLEIDRASGLYDDADYADERRTLERRRLPDGPAEGAD